VADKILDSRLRGNERRRLPRSKFETAAYCAAIMDMPPMREWVEAAKAEPDQVGELDVQF
jgi:hypothetical protein